MSDTPGYTPHDWFWIVGDDETRAWSSAAGAYVTTFDVGRVTRIASEAELDDVLRRLGLASPQRTAADVLRESVRRQCALIGAADEIELYRRTLAGTREATELQNVKIKHFADPAGFPDWTVEQATWAAYLEYIESQLSDVEAAAEKILSLPEIPADFADDSRWPTRT